MNNSLSISVDRDDLELMLLIMIRYALSRASYIPEVTCSIVRRYSKLLGKLSLHKIKEEILNHIEALPDKSRVDSSWKALIEWIDYVVEE